MTNDHNKAVSNALHDSLSAKFEKLSELEIQVGDIIAYVRDWDETLPRVITYTHYRGVHLPRDREYTTYLINRLDPEPPFSNSAGVVLGNSRGAVVGASVYTTMFNLFGTSPSVRIGFNLRIDSIDHTVTHERAVKLYEEHNLQVLFDPYLRF